jgi:hypothetical protein
MGLFGKHTPPPTRDPRPKGLNANVDYGHTKMFWKTATDKRFRNEPKTMRKDPHWGKKLGRG